MDGDSIDANPILVLSDARDRCVIVVDQANIMIDVLLILNFMFLLQFHDLSHIRFLCDLN